MRRSLLTKRMWLQWVGLLACVMPIALHRSSQPTYHTILTLELRNWQQDMAILRDAGFAIAGVNYPKRLVDLEVVTADPNALRGFRIGTAAAVDVRVLDVQEAPDLGYRTHEEIESEVTRYASAFPEIATKVQIGTSLRGRPIWALKISDHPIEDEVDEPAVLFNAMHHAREVMTPEVALDTIDYLLTRYGSDGEVTGWVDGLEIWVVPMLNVDGNHIVWTQNNMWRKNAREDHGVDINRNYPYKWGACNGSSGQKFSEVYRGQGPASEPETQALMNLVATVHPVFSISYHSYSELVLYPFGCEGEHAHQRDLVETLGREIADLLPSDDDEDQRYTPGTSWEILYATDGGDIDWMHATQYVVPFVIELNSRREGFQPSYSQWRDRTVRKVRPAWQHLLRRIQVQAVSGTVRSMDGKAIPDARVLVRRAATEATLQRQVHGDASFFYSLMPGEYTLEVSAPGHNPYVTSVTVEGERVHLEVNLERSSG